MTENNTTEKFQPSPAKEQSPANAHSQTGGRNRAVSGNEEVPAPDVLAEQEKTDEGMPRASAGYANQAPLDQPKKKAG